MTLFRWWCLCTFGLLGALIPEPVTSERKTAVILAFDPKKRKGKKSAK